MPTSIFDPAFSTDETANARRVLRVNADGTTDAGFKIVYDSTSRQMVGWSGSGAIDLRPYKQAQIIAVISAFDSGGGATLSTDFSYSSLAPDATTATVTGFKVGGKTFTATGSGITSWESLTGSGAVTVIATVWQAYTVQPPPYVSITVANAGTTTSITGRVWVLARN